MDGIVPIVYIVLFLGAVFSLGLFVLQGYFWYRGTGSNTLVNKKLFVSKVNLICTVIILLLTMFSKKTIIGYGPLLYVIPIQFIIASLIYIGLRKGTAKRGQDEYPL